MSATYVQAQDDILKAFNDAWVATGFPVDYENKRTTGLKLPPQPATPWARVTLRHTTGGQSSLAGDTGRKRHDREGTLFVQIFTPSGEGLSRSYQLAKIATDAFQGVSTPMGVWFRNARINEIGLDGDWYQLNVLVDFLYDEIT